MTHTTAIPTPADFRRAFQLADEWIEKEMRMRWLPDKRCTPGVANDTLAAIRQARDLVAACHASGLTVVELTEHVSSWAAGWVGEEQQKSPANMPGS